MDDESGLCADETARDLFDRIVWIVAAVFSGGDVGCVSGLQAFAETGRSDRLLNVLLEFGGGVDVSALAGIGLSGAVYSRNADKQSAMEWSYRATARAVYVPGGGFAGAWAESEHSV